MKRTPKTYKYFGLAVVCLIAWTASARPQKVEVKHNFAKAEVVDRIILSVIENYYDPSRIDSKKMFQAIMDTLQKAIAEVTVSYDESDKIASITVLEKEIQVDISDLNGPWGLSRIVREVFRFIEDELPRTEYDFSTLEYAAANAMLSTLDPHSNALPPDIYESLRMDTQGEFGGLGIRITTDRRSPCRGNLTVVDVFDGTPAKRAGLKTGDQIVRIEGESTMNITTSEAADRLRGKPGSSVGIKIRRLDGSTHTFKIQRETIAIKSVQSRMLDGKVGYISLRAFQGNSAEEFKTALAELHDQDMKGLIFDLRGNPGGLLDVAIKIADNFLDSGTIVATAGRRMSEESVRNATASDTEKRYPLVVLINSTSASAAEIIAGALRNHGRVLLVGQTTFGKGSVQMVHPLPGGGALKLTSAQYLTPGDISIQAVGVPSDVTFVPYTVDKKDMDLGGDSLRFSEADLLHHLDRPNIRTRDSASTVVKAKLFIPSAERKADRDKFKRCFVDEKDRMPFRSRYEEEFARRLITRVEGTTTEELLVQARKLIDEDKKAYEQSMQKSLKALGVDWSPAQKKQALPDEQTKSESQSKATASAQIVGAVVPGKTFKLKVTVKNRGSMEISRLHAITKSDNYELAGHELVFGRIKPGRSKSWSASIDLSHTAVSRIDPMTVEFKGEGGTAPEPITVDVEVSRLPEPRLAYGWQIEDLGNGNGLFEPGEELLMHVIVKNVGKGATVDTEAGLSAKPGVDVIQGRFSLGKLRPKETFKGTFRLRVADRFHNKAVKLGFSVEDWIPARVQRTKTLLNREIELPVSPPSPSPSKASGSITAKQDEPTVLFEGPTTLSRKVARARQGASFKIKGSTGDFFKIVLGKNRHAWIRMSDTTPGGGNKPKFSPILIESPKITIVGEQARRTIADKIKIQGHVQHPQRVRDLMVFVGDRKLLYLPNRVASPDKRVPFEVEVPLEVGSNFATVVARYDDKVISSLPIYIRRDDPLPDSEAKKN